MNKIVEARGIAVFNYDYTDSINAMIEDGELESLDGIESLLEEWLREDIDYDLINNPNCGNIDILLEAGDVE